MEQRLSLVTLGVTDLRRAREFYEQGLGWQRGNEGDEIAFYQLGGIVLALYPRDKAEVDRVLDQAAAAGATILKPAQEAFWGGYSGMFADPDGHPWEVAWNPHWPLTEDGRVQFKA